MLGDDYAAKTKLLNLQLASKMEDATSKDVLQEKELAVRDYLQANDRFWEFSTSLNQLYRQSLTDAGVSSSAMEKAVKAFRPNTVSQKPWVANRKLGEAQLSCLQFLETNWGKWSYTNGQILFQPESLKPDYTILQAQVAQAYQELVNLHKTNRP